MLEISSPDALGTIRISVDGIERYTITFRECKVAEGVEYTVASADLSMCGTRYFGSLPMALQFACGRAMEYWG